MTITKRHALYVYATMNAANVLVLFFTYKGILYRVELNRIKAQWTRWEKPCKKHPYRALRLYLNNAIKEELIANYNAKPILTADALEERKELGLNRGEFVEYLEAERGVGTTYNRDRTPWWLDCDVLNGQHKEQVKFQNATICTEAQIQALI